MIIPNVCWNIIGRMDILPAKLLTNSMPTLLPSGLPKQECPNKNKQSAFTIIELFTVLWVAAALAIVGITIDCAAHFIAKFW